MAQTLANADALLKDLYEGPVQEQINQKTYMLDQIERDTEHVDHTGRRAIVPLHKNRNRGRGSIGDGGTLPAAGQQEYQDAIVLLRYHTAAIELTDQAIGATKSKEGAFISLLQGECEGVAQDMKKDLNRQVYGEGNGLLGNCGVTAGSSTVTMATPFDVQYIQIGDTVDIIKKSNGETSTGALATKVTNRNVSNGTVIVEASVTTDNTFGVYVAGNRNLESDGLRNITAAERTLHSIDATAAGNAYWKGKSLKAGTSLAALQVAGESLFEQLGDKVGAGGNGEVEVYITTRGIRRHLADSYQSQKRMNDAKTVEIHGGYTAIMVNEIPVVRDDDCPATFVFGLNKGSYRWYEQNKPGWMTDPNGSGQILHLKTAGTGRFAAAWQGYWRWYAALGCIAPNRNGRIEFCQDDNPAE